MEQIDNSEIAHSKASPNKDSERGGIAERGRTKVRQGVVVSNKMDKTVIVAVTRQYKDRRYAKYVKSTKKYCAHDQENECAIGDSVQIVETRPLSKTKRWRVQKILVRAE